MNSSAPLIFAPPPPDASGQGSRVLPQDKWKVGLGVGGGGGLALLALALIAARVAARGRGRPVRAGAAAQPQQANALAPPANEGSPQVIYQNKPGDCLVSYDVEAPCQVDYVADAAPSAYPSLPTYPSLALAPPPAAHAEPASAPPVPMPTPDTVTYVAMP